jgi:crotonobetainyl-CoA:carnitine CoA-transferase CaiB-like acyl-CoA transferase
MAGALTGLKVVDLTMMLAGPFCTMLLADQGADVIKVEPIAGDGTRRMGPFPPETGRHTAYGAYFQSINRGKRSIGIDLKSPAGKATFERLIRDADVLVENYRAGVMDKLGLGYERLCEINPRLVYAAIRGFGDPRTGESPYAKWPAFDIVAQAMGGMVGTTGPAASAGMPAGASVGDLFPGTLAALGIVAAVHAARRSGTGQFLDVAMYDAVLLLCENIVYKYSMAEIIEKPKGQGHPALCPFDIYETKDGAAAIAAPTETHWRALCEVIGRTELITDERSKDVFRRVGNRDLVNDAIRRWTSTSSTAEVVDALAGKVPVGPVNTAADIFADPHMRIRGMLAEVEQPGSARPITLAGQPIKFTKTQSGVYRRPPNLGEHTEEILAEAGIRSAAKEKE